MARELLVDYLVKALNAVTSTTQDRVAYTIQEVLKFVGCSPKVLNPSFKVIYSSSTLAYTDIF